MTALSDPWVLVIHGGAGLIRRAALSPEREAGCRASLGASLKTGGDILAAGGTALDAVEAAVIGLEDCPLFNAGRGAVFAAGGGQELDAAIADGRTREAGAITGAQLPRNPIRMARAVMERTPHVLLSGAGADRAAEALGVDIADPSWFRTEERWEQYQAVAASGGFTLDHGSTEDDVYGTVGAVACDSSGHLAAATSTGGMVNKLPGRIGDSPLIGAGTWAHDGTCAVSATGHGEPMIRLAVAARVSHWMEMGGLDLPSAAHKVIHEELPTLQGQGGLIACDAQCNVSAPFNTAGMFRGVVGPDGDPQVDIW